MSDTKIDKEGPHSLEELIAMSMYEAKKDKIKKMREKIEKCGGEKKSIDEIRKTLSKIEGSMSDFVVSERE
ncbi:MAG: hypothetical protein ACOC55_01620 [Candidatus Natronoplasma sp.]